MKSLMPQIDSNDGLFHNGNPATGEQGTRVTDTWLNNLQDRVRDIQAEAHYVLQKAGFTPKEETQTQLYQAIVKIIDDNRKTASLTQKGEVQLSSSTNSDSETQAATSKAAKTAYDKAVEAKTAADNAQRTADNKQSPATTLAGYGIGNFKIENFVGNVNTLQTDGIYAVTQASLSQNLPVAGNGCHIQVIAGGDGRWCRQIAYIAYSTDMYERHQTSYQTDSWSPWVKLNDIEPVRQLVAQKANLADFTYQKIGDFEVRKYPDGTMIQSCRVYIPITNRTTIARTLNWALAFADADLRISTTIIYKETNESSRPQTLQGDIDTANATVSVIQESASEFTLVIYDSDVNNAAFFVDIIAIGRWK
jgi:genome